jgi:hypothetical protein
MDYDAWKGAMSPPAPKGRECLYQLSIGFFLLKYPNRGCVYLFILMIFIFEAPYVLIMCTSCEQCCQSSAGIASGCGLDGRGVVARIFTGACS